MSHPEQVGPFRVVDVLGEGGMGIVYLAEQVEPVRRRVAVKVVKPGMASEEILGRFERERQTLAALDHDGIAKVFASGYAEPGPYLAMEYVDGVPLDRFCREAALDLEARLALFRQVCRAVHYAHRRGVLHRDLKPTNVLVVRREDGPVAKVIDFGLAFEVESGAGAEARLTAAGEFVGTPRYMSPEQAGVVAQGVDTRSDIYALGVILYELLTGAHPMFAADGHVTPEDMRRQLSAGVVPRPSARAPTSRVARRLRGELDWILLKALEHEPDRRYPTAAELGDDLDRHLCGEPVSAGPPSAVYRARTLLRRHRGAAVATGLALAALVAGSILSVRSALRAAAMAEVATGRSAAAETARADAATRKGEFDLLAVAEQLAAAEATADELFPPWPSLAQDLTTWLEVDVRDLRAARPGLLAALKDLRARSEAVDGDAAVRGRPEYEDLTGLRSKLAALERARAVRFDGAQVETPELPEAVQRASIDDLGSMLEDVINSSRHDPVAYGHELQALGVARRFVARAGAAHAHDAQRFLALALCAVGLDSEAMEAARRAVGCAPPDERARLESMVRGLEERIRLARGPEGRLELAETRRALAALERSLGLERRRFARPADALLFDTLTTCLAGIDRLLADTVPAVERRLAWAGRIEAASVTRHAARWEQARAAIAASGIYGASGIDLRPQLGLVPIGPNPETGLWEFYHLRSAWTPGAGEPEAIPIPAHREDGSVEVTGQSGIVFVLVPGGTFRMGWLAPPRNGVQDMLPAHEVTLAPYFLARHEMTQGQWTRLFGTNPSSLAAGGTYSDQSGANIVRVDLRHPVEQISWDETKERLWRFGLQLPTEAQWEYAYRAGSTTPFWTGADAASLFAQGPAENIKGGEDGHEAHAPVGSLRANPWGFFDMGGNVSEHCEDRMGKFTLPVREKDGLRLAPVTQASRMVRGGNMDSVPIRACAPIRISNPTDIASVMIGVRPARQLR